MCYFPAAFQGEYVTQSIMSGLPAISYSTLSVAFDSIPVWGTCHKRIGNNVILMDDTGGLTCYKCFNLVLRSSNVLQIHTAGLDKCYTTEEKAVHDCPSDMMIRERRAREIMLYRKFLIHILFQIFSYLLTCKQHRVIEGIAFYNFLFKIYKLLLGTCSCFSEVEFDWLLGA